MKICTGIFNIAFGQGLRHTHYSYIAKYHVLYWPVSLIII